MQRKRYCRCPHRGGIRAGFGALPRGGAPCPAPRSRSAARSATASTSWSANHLGSVGDLFDALERDKDFVEAERLGIEFAEDFRLLQDLGWGERDTRESVELWASYISAVSLKAR